MKKRSLKSLKINKKTISKLSVEKTTGGTGGFYSFVPGLYCGAGNTTSFGPLACQVACLCDYDEY